MEKLSRDILHHQLFPLLSLNEVLQFSELNSLFGALVRDNATWKALFARRFGTFATGLDWIWIGFGLDWIGLGIGDWGLGIGDWGLD